MASVMSTALSRLNAFLDTELEHLLCFDKKSFRAYTTRDNKDIFISTVLIVEAIRYFLSAVRTFYEIILKFDFLRFFSSSS